MAADGINEDTVFVEADLPADYCRNWVWHADLNLVELRRGLGCDEKLEAVRDLSRQWQKHHLRLVESA